MSSGEPSMLIDATLETSPSLPQLTSSFQSTFIEAKDNAILFSIHHKYEQAKTLIFLYSPISIGCYSSGVTEQCNV